MNTNTNNTNNNTNAINAEKILNVIDHPAVSMALSAVITYGIARICKRDHTEALKLGVESAGLNALIRAYRHFYETMIITEGIKEANLDVNKMFKDALDKVKVEGAEAPEAKAN